MAGKYEKVAGRHEDVAEAGVQCLVSKILFPRLSCWVLKSHGVYPDVGGSGAVRAGTG